MKLRARRAVARIPTRLAIGATVPKNNRILATYRINSDEVIQVTVDAVSAYPDGLAECRSTVRGLVKDILADVLELTRDSEPVVDGDS